MAEKALIRENAVKSTVILEKRKLVNIVIAGGGSTGMEMAGMLRIIIISGVIGR